MGKRQTEVPGTEREIDEEVHAAAETLLDAKAKRAEAQEEVTSARENLTAIMQAKSLTEFVDPMLEVKIKLAEKARLSFQKIKTPKPAEAAE